jgi:hypothetical protein
MKKKTKLQTTPKSNSSNLLAPAPPATKTPTSTPSLFELNGRRTAALVKFAQQDLLTFAQLMNPEYEATWFHNLIARKLEESIEKIRNKEKVRLILAIPPRCGKTYLASTLLPAWSLGKYPTMKFILSTYGADLSEKIGAQTRSLMTEDKYRQIFTKTRLRKDTKSKSHFMTTEGGSYTSVGVGGALTGIGADCLIADDLTKSREEAESKAYQDMVWDYFRSTLYSRLEGYGGIIVIMQRWSNKDLVARLLEKSKEEGEEWEVINFPAIAVENEQYRKEGEPLWESKFPIPVLQNIKENVGSIAWNSQYQQDPIWAENQEFKEHMFKTFEEEDLKKRNLRYYTICDPAISQKREADNTVVLTIAKDQNGPNIYRIREDAGHYTPSQTMDLIFKHQNEFHSDVYLETVAYQQALKFMIEEEQIARQKYFTVHEVKTKTNKEVRIRGLLPLYERGVIFHRHTDKLCHPSRR